MHHKLSNAPHTSAHGGVPSKSPIGRGRGTGGVVAAPAAVPGLRSLSFDTNVQALSLVPAQGASTPAAINDAERVTAPSILSIKPSPVGVTPTPLQPKTPGPLSLRVPSNKGEILSDVRQAPRRRYVPFADLDIPLSFNEGFVLQSPSDNHFALLVDVAEWSTPKHHDVANRIKLKCPGAIVNHTRATREVLITLHKQNEEVLANHLKDSTDVEQQGWRLIDAAVAANASDIHIETRGAYAQVFFRINGERVEQHPLSVETATGVCNVLYTFHAESRSKDVSWKAEEVLDTSIEHETADGTHVQIRFSSAPIHPSPNFHAVCRLLLMDESRTPELHEIGFTPGQIAASENMLIGAQGLVLIVGPTNSGKSTTMQAFARRLMEKRGGTIKLITVEDPVEYLIPGACQMGVAHKRKQMQDKDGSVFNTLLNGTLRQDPDVVIVGEIRNEESCRAVKDLVLAGRKLLTTLHVYEAMAVYARLRELGVPESILYMNNFISGVIYQRLVPTLCNHCSIPLIEGHKNGLADPFVFERVSRSIDLTATNVRMRSPGGCPQCGHRGIVGRTVAAEMIVPDETFLQFMRRGDLASARAYWHANEDLNSQGMGVTAVAHALCNMVAGLVDPHDIESQIGPIRVEHIDPSSVPGNPMNFLDGHQPFAEVGAGQGGYPTRLDGGAGNHLARMYS